MALLDIFLRFGYYGYQKNKILAASGLAVIKHENNDKFLSFYAMITKF
jgi:hypothetical protein